jgi:hypothetical protein
MTVDALKLPRNRRLRRLWLVNVVPPLLALTDLQLAYMLAPKACEARQILPAHLLHGTMFIANIAIALLARRLRAHADGDGTHARRTGFMAIVGAALALLSALVVLAHWLPWFFISPCQ